MKNRCPQHYSALAILYSVAAGFGGAESAIPWKNEEIATIAACVILVAGFYGSSIGQERMFRYRYMEMIEKRISEIVPTGDGAIALGWNRFSSRLITANIHHLTNRGARRHYVHFALALVSLSSGVFCSLCYCCLPCIINGSGFCCRWLLCPLLYIFCTAIS